MTKKRAFKVLGWTMGMSFAVYVMLSKGFVSPQEHLEHALIGAAIGLVLGIIFAARVPKI
jgi:uncharacterized membrane protein YqaE (UPF0057 family)